MQYYDIGVNFGTAKYYTDADVHRTLLEAVDAGVGAIVSIGCDLKSSGRSEALSAVHAPRLFYTAGVHPHHAVSVRDLPSLAPKLRRFVGDARCVAVGECGLDYNRMFSPQEQQVAVFEAQIAVAAAYKKPLYMHCRDAFDDFYALLVKHKVGHGVVHCFTGDAEQAGKLVALGLHIGITGWLLDERRNADLVAAVAVIPADRLLVETDAPWVSIDRSRASHPRDVVAIVAELARLRGTDPDELAGVIAANTRRLFRI
jgi:TatD DNase family protein